MAEEKRVRVVFEAVGGAAAADDASRFKTAVEGIPPAAGAAGASTDALEAKLAELQARVSTLQQAQQRQQATQQDFSRVATEATQKSIEFTSKVAAAAGAVQGLTSALGVQGQTAGLIGAMAGSAAAGAQLGAVFGPQGALVGGILGAAIPALAALAQEHDAAAEAAARQREQVDQLRQTLLAQRLEADIAGALSDPAMAGAILGSVPEDTLRQQRDLAAAQARAADERASRARAAVGVGGGRGARLAGGPTARDVEAAEQELRTAQQRMALFDAEIERRARLADETARQAEAQARFTAAQGEQDRAERGRREASQAAEERFQREQAAWEAFNQAVIRGLQQEQDARERLLELVTEQYEKQQELQEAALRAAQEEKAAFERVDAERREREDAFARDSLQRLRTESRDRTEQLDRETAKREEDLAVFGELAGGISRSLVVAVSEVTSGAKTAEEAFKGMLASFLTSIAEQALISAMKEYAEAIAAFARYDFGGGAGHVAAGLAFTGVAVATGAAAGAVAAPSQGQTQPDRPDSMAANDGNYGRTVFVNNWNAPTIAAGTEADVGRTFDRFGRRAAQRFGRIAA